MQGPLLSTTVGGVMEVLCLLYMGSRSSWEQTSGGQTQKGNMEAASDYFHCVLLARMRSSGPTHLRGRLRNVVWV